MVLVSAWLCCWALLQGAAALARSRPEPLGLDRSTEAGILVNDGYSFNKHVLVIFSFAKLWNFEMFITGDLGNPSDFEIASALLLPKFGFKVDAFSPTFKAHAEDFKDLLRRRPGAAAWGAPQVYGASDAKKVLDYVRKGKYSVVLLHSWDACTNPLGSRQEELLPDFRAASTENTKWIAMFEGITTHQCSRVHQSWTKLVGSLDGAILQSYLSLLRFQEMFPSVKHVVRSGFGFVKPGATAMLDKKRTSLPDKKAVCFMGTMRSSRKMKLLCDLAKAMSDTRFISTGSSGSGSRTDPEYFACGAPNLRLITSSEKEELGPGEMSKVFNFCRVALDFSWPDYWMDHSATKTWTSVAHGAIPVTELPNQVAEPSYNYGEVVPAGEDLALWSAAVRRALARPSQTRDWLMNSASHRFSWPAIIGETADFYTALLQAH